MGFDGNEDIVPAKVKKHTKKPPEVKEVQPVIRKFEPDPPPMKINIS
jgi:hypothetical protein